MRFTRNDYRPAPVREGDVRDVTIESVGGKGDGIARIEGFVIFVPGKKQGETAKIRITKVLRKVAFSEVVGESVPVKEAAEPAEEQVEEVEKPVVKPEKKEKKPKKAKKEPKVEVITEKDEEEEF